MEQFTGRAGSAARDAGAARVAAAAAGRQAARREPFARRRARHAPGGERVVRGRARPACRDRRPARLGRERAGAAPRAAACSRRAARSSSAAVDITRAPEAVTGRAIGYVGSPAYLFPARVRDNVLYGLKHRPVQETTYESEAAAEREFQLREAARTGNSTLDIEADWIDYEAAGCTGPEDCDAAHRGAAARRRPRGDDLRARPAQPRPEQQRPGATSARACSKRAGTCASASSRSASATGSSASIRPRTTATPRSPRTCCSARRSAACSTWRTSPATPTCARCCAPPASTSCSCAPATRWRRPWWSCSAACRPGHEFFGQYSFINQDDLPQFEAILKRVGEVGLKGLAAEDSRALLALTFMLIATRHRLGLIDEGFEARVIEARRYFAENLPPELRDAVEFFDPARYNDAATLQDNILFGKIVTGQAGRDGAHHQAGARAARRARPAADGGAQRPRLPGRRRRRAPAPWPTARRSRWCARCSSARCCWCSTRRRRCSTRRRSCAWSRACCASARARRVAWVLSRPEYADRFGVVLVMERGRLVEKGKFAELKRKTG